jgi:hypothetical protein
MDAQDGNQTAVVSNRKLLLAMRGISTANGAVVTGNPVLVIIEMLPANTMYIIDGDCAATSMTSGGDDDRRIAYMKRGFFFHRTSRSSNSVYNSHSPRENVF